jgi:hypothetical protein
MNKKIWNDQLEFNKLFFKDIGINLKKMSVEQRVEWTKEFYIHVNRELNDLLNCLPHWKMHYKNSPDLELIDSNVKEEFIDVLKYLMGLGQVWTFLMKIL